jgi:nucleoside-diphosphate-sugar epimerase
VTASVDTVVYLAGALCTYFGQQSVMTRNALAAAKRNGVRPTFIGPLDAKREFIFVPDVAEPLPKLAHSGKRRSLPPCVSPERCIYPYEDGRTIDWIRNRRR